MPRWPEIAPQAGPGQIDDRVRGTQSFVYTTSWCWKHPSLVALEVVWRWIIGAGAIWLLWTQGQAVLSEATGGSFDPARLGLDHLTVTDPMGAATRLASAAMIVLPLVLRVARWLAPLLLVAWIVVSAVGRTLVLRRADPALVARPWTLVGLQTIRVLALAASFGVWFWSMLLAGSVAVTGPISEGGEPNLVLYFALVIVGTLGLFTLWAVVSWALAVAPLLAMLRDTGVAASLRAAFRLGPLRGKLVEVNLVMGIVKIALIVLAMVFSATPLPFETITTPEFMTWWWAGVSIFYCIASDFFHVARLVAYLHLWRAYEEA